MINHCWTGMDLRRAAASDGIAIPSADGGTSTIAAGGSCNCNLKKIPTKQPKKKKAEERFGSLCPAGAISSEVNDFPQMLKWH